MKRFYTLLLLVCSIACISNDSSCCCLVQESGVCAKAEWAGYFSGGQTTTGAASRFTLLQGRWASDAITTCVSQQQLRVYNVNTCTRNNPSGRVPGTGFIIVFFDVADFETVTT